MLDRVSGCAWIAEFRHRNGLTRREMAKCMTDVFGVFTSELLIGCAELGDPIHPGIAARIAYLAGGTAAQFDAITYKTRRGTWAPDVAERKKVKQRFERWLVRHKAGGIRCPQKKMQGTPRSILMIDVNGNILFEYPSAVEAARAQGCSSQTIRDRCTSKFGDNFRKNGVVWRYADEYTDEERERVIALAKQQMQQPDMSHARRSDLVEYDGEIHTIGEWADKIGMDRNSLVHRFRSGWTIEDALTFAIRAGGYKKQS